MQGKKRLMAPPRTRDARRDDWISGIFLQVLQLRVCRFDCELPLPPLLLYDIICYDHPLLDQVDGNQHKRIRWVYLGQGTSPGATILEGLTRLFQLLGDLPAYEPSVVMTAHDQPFCTVFLTNIIKNNER